MLTGNRVVSQNMQTMVAVVNGKGSWNYISKDICDTEVCLSFLLFAPLLKILSEITVLCTYTTPSLLCIFQFPRVFSYMYESMMLLLLL